MERASASGVTNNHARNSFELKVEGDVAFASYQLSDGELTIFHTEVSLGLRERHRIALGEGSARPQKPADVLVRSQLHRPAFPSSIGYACEA